MRACGIGRPQGTNDPIDRIDSELEFLEWLCLLIAGTVHLPTGMQIEKMPGGSPEATYDGFVREHVLTWVPRFAGSVRDEAREPFYRMAADLLAAAVEDLA